MAISVPLTLGLLAFWLAGSIWLGPRAQAPALAQQRRAPDLTAELLDHQNRVLSQTDHALGISRHITHDGELPRTLKADEKSADSEAFRLQVRLPGATQAVLYAALESTTRRERRSDVLRHIPLRRVGKTSRYRSRFVRLVSDATDLSAPGVGGQVLRANLHDRVHVMLDARPGERLLSFRVGHVGQPFGERSVLRGTLRISVLRSSPGARPVIGNTESEARRLARRQVEIANEIWAQCFIEFGSPEDASVRVVDPPPSALLAVSDVDGLPARGDGEVVFRAGSLEVGPIRTRKGALPAETAQSIADAARALGMEAEVTVNPRTDPGVYPSADVVFRDPQGFAVGLAAAADRPLSSDAQQRVAIGHVDLSDGIEQFDNALSAAGTLEERTLVKLLADRDPRTIDVFLVSHFVAPQRQGEAFIAADHSSMANVLIFGRDAVRFERQAWVQAHELGHVLLDEPSHPDNFGRDRPWLLMDADARQGRVTGPKRLRSLDCQKARRRSGPGNAGLLMPVSESSHR